LATHTYAMTTVFEQCGGSYDEQWERIGSITKREIEQVRSATGKYVFWKAPEKLTEEVDYEAGCLGDGCLSLARAGRGMYVFMLMSANNNADVLNCCFAAKETYDKIKQPRTPSRVVDLGKFTQLKNITAQSHDEVFHGCWNTTWHFEFASEAGELFYYEYHSDDYGQHFYDQ
jgi:hypothetical protein